MVPPAIHETVGHLYGMAPKTRNVPSSPANPTHRPCPLWSNSCLQTIVVFNSLVHSILLAPFLGLLGAQRTKSKTRGCAQNATNDAMGHCSSKSSDGHSSLGTSTRSLHSSQKKKMGHGMVAKSFAGVVDQRRIQSVETKCVGRANTMAAT